MLLMADEVTTTDNGAPAVNPVPPATEPAEQTSAPQPHAVVDKAPPSKPPRVGTDAGDGEQPGGEQPEEPKAEDTEEPKAEEEKKPDTKHWYVVKVQSGREESIKDAIERRVKIEGLEEYFGQILIPVEKVTELRKGKRYVKSRKLYPGYLMVNVEYNENILYLFRETSGVGDFVGGSLNKPPQPMKQAEVDKMMGPGEGPAPDEKIKLRFGQGDRVKIRDGAFSGMEGEVKDMLEAKAHVRVEVTIFGRPVSVELEYWQVEPV
jgi:transcription termination/antitermination protein NusG